MTVVQNTEYGPNMDPIRGVKVTIEAVVEASLVTGAGSVFVSTTVSSNSDGVWSADLYPSSQLRPLPGAYRVTRKYPARFKEPPHVDFILVPNVGPVQLSAVLATRQEASPITDSELQAHLESADPHAQYITQAELAAALEGFEGSGEATPDATDTVKGKLRLTGHLGGTADDPEISVEAFNDHSMNDLGAPSGPVPMGTQKFTALLKGEDPTDSASMENIADHVADTNPHSAAGYQRYIEGSDYGPPTTGGPFTPGNVAISKVSRRQFVNVVGGLPGSAVWQTEPRVTRGSTPSSPLPTNHIAGDVHLQPIE